jgi:lipopolysaccharide biosynthesis glycosyltransferase
MQIQARGEQQRITASQAGPIAAVTAADDRYAMPLAVTVRTALDCLAADSPLQLYIVDGGVSAESKERLARSWDDRRLRVTWLQPDLSVIDELPVSHHVTRMTYARMLLPAVLPRELDRVLYLDADLLVRRDLTKLWHESVEGFAAGACVDSAAPLVDGRLLANYCSCKSYLAATFPIPNWQALGLHPDAGYFNAGVMLVNLAYWRTHGIMAQAFECLEKNREHLLWWDQYVLNVVLHQRWRQLDPRWNQGAHIHVPGYALPGGCPLDAATYETVRRRPWIVHFTSPVKPWHFESSHPFRFQFLKAVDRTAWKGWRPAKPYGDLAGWWSFQKARYEHWRKQRRVRRKHFRTLATLKAA